MGEGAKQQAGQAPERAVPRPQIAYPDPVPTAADADAIEQWIIRAYLRLAFHPNDRTGSRTATVLRSGGIEARLTEVPGNVPNLPSYWLEIYSHRTRSVIDSRGYHDFNEAELFMAVDLVLGALERHRSLQ